MSDRDSFSEYDDPYEPDNRIATLESEVAALRKELAQHRASLPTCEKHKPDRGARSGCVICSGEKLSHALSRIDYACGEPNEMDCSDYDLHYNEDEVVKRVVALRAEVEGMRGDAERYRELNSQFDFLAYLRGREGERHMLRCGPVLDSWLDAKLAARKESSK